MSSTELVLLGLVMLLGFVGIVVPMLPGLLLMVAAALWWAIADGGGWVHWFVFALIVVIAAGGTTLKYMVPAKTSADAGTHRTSLILAFALAIVLFFVIPVVGAPLGFVLGVYAGEWWRLRDTKVAWTATKAALKGVALGALIEGAAAVLILGTWVVGVQATGGDFGLGIL
jgi:uncharacterized protein YqgC (DUF456 family)